ncbi:MAG: hypothetical protein GY863_10755 [bacterium]|nr:hypothetical protein [bacterium]
MPTSQKIGSFRPLTFRHSGDPVRPVRPQAVNKEPSMKGIKFAGEVTFSEFSRNIRERSNVGPQELGRGAVRLQKFTGISLNVTI